jgi:hypothetical protein
MFRGKNECQISLIDLLAGGRCHLNFSLPRILALCGQQNHLLFDEGFPKRCFKSSAHPIIHCVAENLTISQHGFVYPNLRVSSCSKSLRHRNVCGYL